MKRWPIKQLGELVDFVGGGTPRRDRPDYWGGEIPWASVKDLQSLSLEITLENITAKGLANSASNLIPKGTVIIASRVGLGKVAINLKPVAINQDLKALTPRSSDLSPRYLLLFLLSKAKYFERTGVGATVKGLTLADYQKLDIVLPPLAEQERIVKLLDEADELRKLRAQADRRTTDLISSLFHEMFGDPVENSKEWPCVQLVGLCCSAENIKCGPFGTQLSKSEYIEKGVPLWGIKHVNALFELPTQEFLTPSTAQRLIQYSIEPCDIVMTRKGTVGNCAVYPERFPLGIMHSDLLRLRVSREKCEPVFLAHQLHYSHDVERQLAQISGGAVMPGINVTKLKSLKVLAPPLPLQKEFAARVSESHAMQAEQTASRYRLDKLFQSMLHRAFQGEL
jgi:type I restriction enzyme S subunit